MDLELQRLEFSRPGFSLDVSLRLESGKTGVILGPSGCGKTTLLRLVAGLERAGSGEVILGGRRLGDTPPEKRNLGFVFQDLALFDHLDGRRNIAFGLRIRGFPDKDSDARTVELAGKLRIGNLLSRKPPSMSGGERQRLAFARAIAPDPDLMLLDEPLSSLDASLRREIRAFLREELTSRGITALHVTHDVEEALELADTLFLMHAGRIIAAGDPESLWRDPPDANFVRFMGLGVLLPAVAVRRAGAMRIVTTPFGDFACPGFNDRTFSGRSGSPGFLFFPRNAARLRGGASPGNRFSARVLRSVFEGDSRRLVVEGLPEPGPGATGPDGQGTGGTALAGKGLAGAGGAEEGAWNRFEIEAGHDPDLSLPCGSVVEFRVPPEKCFILPETAETHRAPTDAIRGGGPDA